MTQDHVNRLTAAAEGLKEFLEGKVQTVAAELDQLREAANAGEEVVQSIETLVESVKDAL